MKALRSLERKEAIFRFPADVSGIDVAALLLAMRIPTEYRLQQVQQAMWAGAKVEDVFAATKIDRWFLHQLDLINLRARELAQPAELTLDYLKSAKEMGFSDAQIGQLRGVHEEDIRKARHHFGLHPVYKTVDTCAAEFEAFTPYHYSSYEEETEVRSRTKPAVIILGSGPNRIGQGIEFDY